MWTASRALAVGIAGLVAALSIALAIAVRDEQPTPEHLYVAPWGTDDWPGTADRPLGTHDRVDPVHRHA
jgi:hypothetical protein